ncbi:EF-hand calcium-binding domain-containing protein 10 [Rhizophlyctis rosea]|uniref:EF-hand calcium-binding domain-containing protein 10 n=1 Tax=Rhizophlyctis rosea TaxID=64517 RepID=A0AAD5SDK8_9FUNG|nr:EF-hand calcium-binding domain-containing protein 10 [Rhizophlyctis rosea]
MPATTLPPPSQPTNPHSQPPSHTTEATDYLTKHRVPHILQMLTTAVLFERPDDPKEFMVRKLEEMRNAKARGQSLVLFTRDNLLSLFRIFDVTGKGHISLEQYHEAMKNVGAANPNPKPAGADTNRIPADTFVEEALRALYKS